MKTKKKNQSLIYDIVKEKHNYDIFEFAVYDITSVSNDYLKWLDENNKWLIVFRDMGIFI